MKNFFANLSNTWKAVSAIVGFVALGIAIFSAGFGARGTVDEAVNVPAQLQTIQATQEEGFEAVDMAIEELSDSVAAVQETVKQNGEQITELDRRIEVTEDALCSDTELEHNGFDRRVDCAALKQLREMRH